MQLAVLSCFFNPTGSSRLRNNLRRYVDGLGAHARWLHVVECIAPGRVSELDGLPRLTRVRSASVLWHKERLLNIALAQLPASVEGVVWADADLLFENPRWFESTAQSLRDCDVLQPFSSVCQQHAEHLGVEVDSFASRVSESPSLARERFNAHGHTGYAWAMRADYARRSGLFDACVIGGADHVMAHAFVSSEHVACAPPLLGPIDGALHRAYLRWRARLHGSDGHALRLGVVPGRVRHLAHGSRGARRYLARNVALDKAGFDPVQHLRRNAYDAWEWTDEAATPRRLVERYFAQRNEDEVVDDYAA